MLHCYFVIEYLVKQLEQLSTQQSTPTQDETDYNESMEEGMESEDEAIEGYEEHDPAYEVDDDSTTEDDDEEFIEEASE